MTESTKTVKTKDGTTHIYYKDSEGNIIAHESMSEDKYKEVELA